MWQRTLSNERRLNSDYIDNSHDALIQGNLSVSGTLQSPITNLLSVSSNTINTKVENLTISSALTNNKLEFYNTDINNHLDILGASSNILGISINQNTTNFN